MTLAAKQDALLEKLRGYGSVMVAYSGGADSAYLAWAAYRALGDRCVAVTADSPSFPESHKRDAEQFVKRWGIPHKYIETREFENPDYVKNDGSRCFHCKDELFRRMQSLGTKGSRIIYGVNVDDLGDYRPGQRAALEHGIEAPLVEVGLSKAEIRALSKEAGLETWDRQRQRA